MKKIINLGLLLIAVVCLVGCTKIENDGLAGHRHPASSKTTIITNSSNKTKDNTI